MMLSGVPNLALALGYTNASWTLKCDLVSEYVCRLLNHMDERGYGHCVPSGARSVGGARAVPRPAGRLRPAGDRRAAQAGHRGRRGACTRTTPRDLRMLRRGSLEDEGIEFVPLAAAPEREAEPVA